MVRNYLSYGNLGLAILLASMIRNEVYSIYHHIYRNYIELSSHSLNSNYV